MSNFFQKKSQIILIAIYCLIKCNLSYSQVITPENYDEVTAIQNQQGGITSKVLRLLEKGEYDSVFVFIDSEYGKSHKDIRNLLMTASNEIQKYFAFTKVSEGLIVYDKTHNIYRCSYYDTSGEKFLIDIYFVQGNKNSKIVQFAIKKKDQLDKERADNLEWQKKNKNQPPPPPPQ
jgi:hypothetical protein